MFKNIRRNSKQLFEARRKSVATPPAQTVDVDAIITDPPRITFFHLPAEIRNAVYEDVARDTRVIVPRPSKKPSKVPPPVPSLLTVSKQARMEYIPLLLECASLSVIVKDFDFRNLRRITSSLYSTELKALRHNERLTVHLQIEKCTKASMVALRNWLVDRSKGLDRLAWKYSVTWSKYTQILPTSSQVHRINTYLQRRALLNQNLEAMAGLHHNVDESLQFELQPIIRALEEGMDRVNIEPVSSAWRDESALMMHGMRMISEA